jgi:hypothetical protein
VGGSIFVYHVKFVGLRLRVRLLDI